MDVNATFTGGFYRNLTGLDIIELSSDIIFNNSPDLMHKY